MDQENYAEALAADQAALAVMARLAADYPKEPQWRKDLAVANDAVCWASAALGRFDAALAHCGEAMRLQPDYSNARSNRAFTYLKMGRPRDALADYDEVLRQNAKDEEALYGRGLARLQLGDKDAGAADIAAAKAIKADVGK